MKYVDEYRDPALAGRLLAEIRRTATRPWTIMEVCGGQTHTIVREGLDRLLPESITLVHGPGCPVCVTPAETLDRAIGIASRPGVTLCSFGDMLRVPGTAGNLLAARAGGADVRMVYSPLDAVALAAAEPSRTVVFFAVGFETTAPATALAVLRARAMGLANFRVLAAHVLVPPAMAAVLADPDCPVQAFLAAGHVCTVVGSRPYEPLAARFGVPIVVTGFEPADLLEGILLAVRQLESGRAEVENQYARCVRPDGNPEALRAVETVYEPTDRAWRGLGVLPASGLRVRDGFADFDAERLFPAPPTAAAEGSGECRAGEVLRGRLRPDRCPAFGTRCTPEHPLGAPMVSSEGACAAYFRYGRAEAAR